MQQRRYHTLDGMRGLAALIVAAGHGSEWFFPLTLAHSWLAVDLFFVLSGFVLAKVYEPRFSAGLGGWEFMKQRYIRLYPLYFVGITLSIFSGLAALVTGHGGLDQREFAVAAVTGLLLLPSIFGGAHSAIVPLNTPGWSLVFELMANLLYGVFFRFMSSIALALITAISAVTLIYSYMQGYTLGGTILGLFWLGFPRVGFSFCVGVLIARYLPERRILSTWSWVIVVSLLPLLYWAPTLALFADPIIQLAVMPLLVAVGASIEPKNPRIMMAMGIISYPIYAIHVPVFVIVNRLTSVGGVRAGLAAPFTGLVMLCALICVALLLDRYYDSRARKWLTLSFSPRRPVPSIENAALH